MSETFNYQCKKSLDIIEETLTKNGIEILGVTDHPYFKEIDMNGYLIIRKALAFSYKFHGRLEDFLDGFKKYLVGFLLHNNYNGIIWREFPEVAPAGTGEWREFPETTRVATDDLYRFWARFVPTEFTSKDHFEKNKRSLCTMEPGIKIGLVVKEMRFGKEWINTL